MARAPLIDAIRIAPELEREGRAGQSVAMPVSDGSAEAARAFAGEFSGVAQRLGALADHAAQREGQLEGHLAGADPEFRNTRRDGTIRGEAFDKAALQTAEARARIEIHNEIEAAETKHRADPKGLGRVLVEKEKAWAGNAPVELQPEIRNLFAKGGTAAMRQATRQLQADQAEASRATLQEEVQRSLKTIQQRAYGGGLDEAAVEALAGDVATLQRSLGRRGPDGRPLLAPAAAARLVTEARETVVRAQIEGTFDRLPDAEAKQKFIEAFDDQFRTSTGPASAFDFKTFEAVKGKLESQLSKDLSRQRQVSKALSHLVSEVERRATDGEPVRRDEVVGLAARVRETGDPELAAKFDDAVDSLDFQQNLRTLPVAGMRQAVDQMRQQLAGDPATLADRGRIGRRLKHAETMLAKAESEVARDPLAWEGRVGMASVQPLGTVDFKTPGTLEAWGATRTGQAEEAANRHGLGRPVYLQPTEKRALAKEFEQGGEKSLVAVTLLRRAFGDKAGDVLAELGPSAPAGVVIADLALKAGPVPAVLDAAEGLALKAKAGHKHVSPSAEKAKLAADTEIGGALGRNGTYQSRAMKVADAIYETRAYREGKTEAFDEKLWRQAFREALGEHQVGGRTYGGVYKPSSFYSHKVVLPPSVPQDKAGAIFSALTPEDLGDEAGNAPRRGVRTLTRQELRGATLVTVEPGKYLLSLGDPSGADPKWAVDRNGRAYVLDLEAALPAIRRRRPDLK